LLKGRVAVTSGGTATHRSAMCHCATVCDAFDGGFVCMVMETLCAGESAEMNT